MDQLPSRAQQSKVQGAVHHCCWLISF